MDIGGIGPGPKLLLGGGPRIPGPYEPGPIGPKDGPLGGFILFMGFIPGGPKEKLHLATFMILFNIYPTFSFENID